MMLIHHDEAALGRVDYQELGTEYAAFTEALAKADGCSVGERLQPSSAATTVRQHDSKTDVLDGPYADTKEQLGGYYLVEVPDLDAALAWAARCPAASFGAVEVRPVWPVA